MLQFLRRHQRKFFLVITVVIGLSFTFFGTFNTMVETQEVPDSNIAKSIGGRSITQRELNALCQMISTSALDPKTSTMPNLLNDGVIEKDLLFNGMGVLLAKHYFPALESDLDVRLKKTKSFRPYSHSQTPFLNAQMVWQKFVPDMPQHLEQLKKQGDQCSMDTFTSFCQLYLDQAMLPPDMLKQVLMFQQQQQGLTADPLLAQADLSLFGFGSLEDWFGPSFVELSAQFILNVATLAEKRGYEVKNEEVRNDLFQNIYSGYKRFSRNASLSMEEAEQYYQKEIRHLGLDERTVVTTWRKVMLFRRLFEDVGGSVLIDALPYKQFEGFSQQSVKIDLYEIPPSLQLNDFQSMLKLQVYLENVASNPNGLRTNLSLPGQSATLEQIEKRCPELVQRTCEVEFAHVKKTNLESEISLKETWDWEIADANWVRLKKEFPELTDGATKQERLTALDSLETSRRAAVDKFARSSMINGMPYKIQQALDNASTKNSTIGLRGQGSSLPFMGFENKAQLISFLETASIGEQAENLACFSGDQENFYRIKVTARDAQKRLLAYAEASKDGTLDKLLEERLEEVYPDARKKNPTYYQLAKGGWKPVREVKDQVGRHMFNDLMMSIEKNYQEEMGPLPGKSGELPLQFYANYRLFSHMQDAAQDLNKWVVCEEDKDSFLDQWRLVKSERTVKRSDRLSIPKEEMFALKPQQWSPIKVGTGGSLAFFQVLEQNAVDEVAHVKIAEGHQILAMDARRKLMMELISMIEQKKSIELSKPSAERH